MEPILEWGRHQKHEGRPAEYEVRRVYEHHGNLVLVRCYSSGMELGRCLSLINTMKSVVLGTAAPAGPAQAPKTAPAEAGADKPQAVSP